MNVSYHRLLTLDEQRALDVKEPAPLAMAGRVHHDELDALLHVNNVVYFVWFERLRIRLMEHYGIGTIGAPEDPRIVIRSGEVHYIEEMLRDEIYIVTTAPVAYRRTSMTLEQVIWSDGRRRATFRCVMVLLTPDGSARMSIPETVTSQLIADGAVAEG
ncbi:MAG: acyl-CoA thioesterase [Pseudomonadota bacterium]